MASPLAGNGKDKDVNEKSMSGENSLAMSGSVFSGDFNPRRRSDGNDSPVQSDLSTSVLGTTEGSPRFGKGRPGTLQLDAAGTPMNSKGDQGETVVLSPGAPMESSSPILAQKRKAQK